jgi:hypothetical protein
MTKLSRLHTLDLPSAVSVPRGDHSVPQDPGQESNHDPKQSAGNSMNPDHDRITQRKPERKWGGDPKKPCEEKYSGQHKTERQFYEGTAHRVRQKNSHEMIIHRVKTGYEGGQLPTPDD